MRAAIEPFSLTSRDTKLRSFSYTNERAPDIADIPTAQRTCGHVTVDRYWLLRGRAVPGAMQFDPVSHLLQQNVETMRVPPRLSRQR